MTEFLTIILFIGFLFIINTNNFHIVSPAGLFILLNIFYITGLYLYPTINELGLGRKTLPSVIEAVNQSSILGAIAFCFSYYFFDKNKPLSNDYPTIKIIRLVEYLTIYYFVFVVLILNSSEYGWHTYSRLMIDESVSSSLGFTVYAYLKYIFVCMGILIFCDNNLSKKNYLLVILAQIIFVIYDGGRTTFLGLVIAIFSIYSRWNAINYIKILIAGGLSLLFLLLTRSLSIEGDLISVTAGAVIFESAYALASTMQIVESIMDNRMQLLFGATYLLDPIVYILPSGIRDNFLLFNNVIEIVEAYEKYSPFGGFYYVGEAYANFGFPGPILIATIWGYIIYFFSKLSWNYFIFKLAFYSTIGTIFVKQNFANGVKLFLVYVIFMYGLRIVFMKKYN